ncbi:hypothetical protein [Streptomyces tubercidicus]|uniref:Uncharacterized protein n=1 Tax=Streptomyces tubercidicus TaxID=47759 RepID=A0A640UYW3_9ACTN|nr:hypothetical protein [Streptomyces tubercidicus]WAU15429.1 hypothetical protein STRTU_006145 [Streptomyces tubercidicus]GFE41283.1 hypothetical protein Stube_59560 [Streptomyces tubercidicus]
MTTGCKTTTVFLTVLCALLLTILGLVQVWPTWAWATLAVLVVGAPAAALRIAAARRGSVPVGFEEQRTAVPIERTEHRIRHVPLPSQWADYDFLFSATVRWYPLEANGYDPVANPAGLAVETVLDHARALTEQREPGRASLVQHELSGALSRMSPDHTGHLQVMAENVTLTLREHDQARLDKLAEVRKDKAVWEHQRKYEQSKREYLGEDVLKDTGSAVVWWLAKNDDHLEKTVGDLGLLAQLTSAANDTDVPDRLRDFLPQSQSDRPYLETADAPSASFTREPTAADHFEAFLSGMGFTDGDDRRGMLAKQIADIIKTQERHETAEELLRRFDPPASYGPVDDAPSDTP